MRTTVTTSVLLFSLGTQGCAEVPPPEPSFQKQSWAYCADEVQRRQKARVESHNQRLGIAVGGAVVAGAGVGLLAGASTGRDDGDKSGGRGREIGGGVALLTAGAVTLLYTALSGSSPGPPTHCDDVLARNNDRIAAFPPEALVTLPSSSFWYPGGTLEALPGATLCFEARPRDAPTPQRPAPCDKTLVESPDGGWVFVNGPAPFQVKVKSGPIKLAPAVM